MASFDESHKNRVGKALTLAIAKALEEGKLTVADYTKVSNAILETIDDVQTTEDLAQYLEELNHIWPIFSHVLETEKGQAAESTSKETAVEIGKLMREQKVDEALATAQQATRPMEDTHASPTS